MLALTLQFGEAIVVEHKGEQLLIELSSRNMPSYEKARIVFSAPHSFAISRRPRLHQDHVSGKTLASPVRSVGR